MRVLHRETAEDLTDDVFLAALEHYGGYDPARGSVHTWLSAIAHNLVVNYRASAHTRREISVWVMPERPTPDSGWQEQGEGTLTNPVNRRACRILEKLTSEERPTSRGGERVAVAQRCETTRFFQKALLKSAPF